MPEFNLKSTLNYQSLENDKNFVVISMFTENYKKLALRLKNSLDTHNINYLIIDTPSVHNSISPKGTPNLSYTKPKLINQALNEVGKPILYLDCDTVIESYPNLIDELVTKRIDFSIFNWLSEEDNCAYVPLEHDDSENKHLKKIYRYSHSIEHKSTDQLICSGAVQFWNTSSQSKRILSDWQEAIATYEQAQDDHCLDFAFNNINDELKSQLKFHNLPKSYSRYAWWIFDQPVINHPQIPFSGSYFKEIAASNGKQRCYLKNLTTKKSVKIIQEGELLDTQNQVIYKSINGELIASRINKETIWI